VAPVNRNEMHADARGEGVYQRSGYTRDVLLQSCTHYCMDAKELWRPQESHLYSECGRRDEVQHGTFSKNEVYIAGYCVCVPYFCNTFGLSKKVYFKLIKHAGASYLPPIFSHGGSIKSNMERHVREYIATIPRHYSHYSPVRILSLH
jgi:hypothetical protein